MKIKTQMKLLPFAMIVLLSACDAETYDVSNKYAIPPQFSDCMFADMRSTDGSVITVVRCPNSSTSTIRGGKAHETAIVIDGVQYEPVQPNAEHWMYQEIIPNNLMD